MSLSSFCQKKKYLNHVRICKQQLCQGMWESNVRLWMSSDWHNNTLVELPFKVPWADDYLFKNDDYGNIFSRLVNGMTNCHLCQEPLYFFWIQTYFESFWKTLSTIQMFYVGPL